MIGGIVLTIFALYTAQAVLIPLVLAVLLSFLLAPLCERIEHWRVPRVLAVVGVMLAVLTIMLGIAGTLFTGANSLLDNLPLYQRNAVAKIDRLDFSGSGLFDKFREAQQLAEDAQDQLVGAGDLPEEGDADFIGPDRPMVIGGDAATGGGARGGRSGRS